MNDSILTLTEGELLCEANAYCMEHTGLSFVDVLDLVRHEDDTVYGTLIECKVKSWAALLGISYMPCCVSGTTA